MLKVELKKTLPYIGIPFLVIALLIYRMEMQAFILFQSMMIIAFGYVAAVCDLKTKRVPNILVLTMLGSWVITMTSYLFWDINIAPIFLRDAAFGFLAGGLLFMLIYIVSRKSLGGGDVKFMASAGLYIGFDNTLEAMFYGWVFAGFTALTLMLLKKSGRQDAMPLIPFLYFGILLVIFF